MRRIYKTGMNDWEFYCEEHDDRTSCSDWQLALETAYGHFVYWHKPRLPVFEVSVSDGTHEFSCIGFAKKV